MSEITVETNEAPTFIKKKHELAKLLKSVESASPEAVKLLTDTMNNTEVPLKDRINCATQLIEFHKGIAQQINADEMARLIAESRLGKSSKVITLEDGKKPTPALNFEDVREV